ncbi:MAG TPA: NAD/NADP octopine/nopaline dehydrogenase family protein [Anaerolineaceae bacterium]|jgi:opine dehydrogenase|nr:NAD/NADP octopine/nopaline dehydrogenase family protein [Anaerolineaceae bacterium]HPS33242.1 NAD/NADP octopine/nopaline dehydrogenase family protein [Anaerolineaceae bacterium]
MNDNLKYTVIGAGNGGKAMAAHMALMGKEVTLFNRTFANIEVIAERGGIDLENPGGISGFGRLAKVTDKIGEAVADADVIMVVVPSSGHRDIAAAAAPYLRDGQIVLLHPGRTCGAIEFVEVLRQSGCKTKPIVAEAETFIYASRSEGPSHAKIFRIKESVPLAALPATKNRAVLDAIHHVYPQYIDGGNVLKTGLNNMGAVFHPTITLLNAGWIETTHGDFEFYIDGVSPSVAKLLETVDRERCTVASALGIRARNGLEWLALAYDARGENLHEAIHNQSGYYGIKAPPTLNHRYLFEEIPMSLVPIAALGQRYGVSVRGIDAIIRLACIIHNTDYWRKGRTLDKLGIQDLSIEELTHYVETGERE